MQKTKNSGFCPCFPKSLLSGKGSRIKKHIQKIANNLDLATYSDFRQFLKDVYEQARSGEKDYSYSLFSYELGLGACNTSHLLISGKRKCTIKTAEKIARNLGMTKAKKEFFLALASRSLDLQGEEAVSALKGLMEAKARLLAETDEHAKFLFFQEWHHSAIMEILRMSTCPVAGLEGFISEALDFKVPEVKIRASLELLEELRLVARDGSQRLAPTNEVISTGAETTNEAIKGYHLQFLEVARQALPKFDAKNRDFSSLTFSFPAERVPELKREIIDFRKRIIALAMNPGASDAVLQLNVQLFPVAMDRGGKSEK